MHPKDIDHTHIECSYNRHNQYLNANVWNTEKRDTKQNRDLVWCWLMLHTGIWNIPMKSCTYPWSLRLPPVQFTRVMVASLVSVPATRAVYRSFRPQCRAGSIWRCRFRRSCCVEWFSRWLVLRLFFLKCCSPSKAHWSHVLSAFTIITIHIWMSVCEKSGTLSKSTI